MSKYQSKEFRALQAEWYKKLKESGFVDIEEIPPHCPDHPRLKEYARSSAKRLNPANEHYFTQCRFFLCHGHFASSEARKVWELHSEGVSFRKMVPLLKDLYPNSNPPSIFTLHKMVKRMRADMFSWLPNTEEYSNEGSSND
jgi:hypothetical protein